jgi:hypothetical protein
MLTDGNDVSAPDPGELRGSASRPSFVVSLVLGALIWASLRWILDGLGVEAGEARALRWARKLGEHPLRVSLAIGLFLQSLKASQGRPGGEV